MGECSKTQANTLSPLSQSTYLDKYYYIFESNTLKRRVMLYNLLTLYVTEL